MTVWFPPEVESENVACDHCGSEQERVILEGPDRLHHLPGAFRVVECRQCGWLRQNPRPTRETIGFYYPTDYINFQYAVEDEATRLQGWSRRYGLLKRRRAVERLQPGERLLDVGCATGLFLHEMDLAGWDVVGIEPSPKAAAYAQQRFGLPVHTGILKQVALPSDSFDVVTLWDVVEHLHTPWADLREVHRLLKDDGLLVLRFPNLESPEKRWFGKTWLGWDLPRHLYYFPRQSLVAALSELGFQAEGFRCLAGSHHSWVLSLQFLLEDRFSPHARRVQWSLKAARSFPARLALAVPFWLLSQTHQSSLITLFARKQPSSETRA